MTPPPLPVRHMSRWDFYGVLFVNFPAEMPWDDARRELERLIRMTGETEITPATIYTAFWAKGVRMLANLPPEERDKRAAAFWAERAKRYAARKAQKPSTTDWSF